MTYILSTHKYDWPQFYAGPFRDGKTANDNGRAMIVNAPERAKKFSSYKEATTALSAARLGCDYGVEVLSTDEVA